LPASKNLHKSGPSLTIIIYVRNIGLPEYRVEIAMIHGRKIRIIALIATPG